VQLEAMLRLLDVRLSKGVVRNASPKNKLVYRRLICNIISRRNTKWTGTLGLVLVVPMALQFGDLEALKRSASQATPLS
jgi:hypothetical protein